MKDFDFEASHHSPERVALLRAWHDINISENKWVELVQELPKKELHNCQTRCASSIRRNYRSLQKKFGFFK